MNGVVRLKHIDSFKKVNYYSVCLDHEDEPIANVDSLFEIFVQAQTKANKDRLNHILAWIAELGNKYGAKTTFFRDEQAQGEAMGLPPGGQTREPIFTEDGEPTPNNLRLYCHRLNDHVVILFSGDLKTEPTAQECPNVRSHFELANRLSVVIDEGIKEGDIRWNDDYSDIDFDDDMILEY
jgi:hypothetical protein